MRKLIVASLLVVACGSGSDDRNTTPPAAATQALNRPSTLSGISIGTPADTVLARRGKALDVVQVGSDQYGLNVEWRYSDGAYVMGRREQNGITAYRVIAIRAESGSQPTAAASSESSSAPAMVQARARVRSMDAFLSSPLATKYRLRRTDGWALRSGGYNLSRFAVREAEPANLRSRSPKPADSGRCL